MLLYSFNSIEDLLKLLRSGELCVETAFNSIEDLHEKGFYGVMFMTNKDAFNSIEDLQY